MEYQNICPHTADILIFRDFTNMLLLQEIEIASRLLQNIYI